MDTLEWGTSEAPGRARQWWRPAEPGMPASLTRFTPGRWARPAAFGLIVAGFLVGLIAQMLPWQIERGAASDAPFDGRMRVLVLGAQGSVLSGPGTQLHLTDLGTAGVTSYYLCWILLMVLVGVMFAGRTHQRRLAGGAALGAAGALAMVLTGLLRSVDDTEGNAELTSTAGPGAVLACVAAALVAAGLLATVIPPRRQAPAGGPSTAQTPGDLTVHSAPIDLTVTAVPPADERIWVRPTEQAR